MDKCPTCGDPVIDGIGCPKCYAASRRENLYDRISRDGEPKRDPHEEEWGDDR